MDSEYTIRVTGGPPPPLPTAKGGKKGSKQRGGGGKNAALAQQQKRYNMRLRPSTPLDQFRRDVFALFNIPSNSTHLYNISFLGGFPPKELDQTDKNTVEQLGIRANESVIVKITLNDSNAAGSGSSTTNTTSDSKQSTSSSSPAAAATTSNNGRQKRAAAEAATASFPELIAAQNEMMKTEQKKKSSNVQSFGGTNNRIATTFSSLPNGGGGGKKSNKKTKIEGTGYRLSDGKAVEGSNKRKRSTKQQQQPLFKSEDDIAGKLLSSMGSGGGSDGNTGKFLRMAMKGAVEKSYEESRAAVRVAAVNKGAFSFEKKGGTVVEGTGVVLGTAKDHDEGGDDHEENEILGRTLYIVSYDKGLEGRGRYEEQVEIISEDALKGLIEHVYNTPSEGDDDEEDADENSAGKEMLRPVSMAQLSPRVFWSLVYHYNKANQNEPSANASVETMLQSTMPQLCWKHLDRGGRKRNRSEKARENWRQKKEAALLPTKSETDEDGVKAIEEMEESILEAALPTKNDDGDNELSERERRARAAMARFGNGGDTETATKSSTSTKLDETKLDEDDEASDDWMLVTPTEDDIDELIECIIEGREESETYDDKDAKVWAAALVDNVRNWRGLANADGEVVLSQVNNNDNLQLGTIERWIEAAQQRSMEEIMLEILDGDQDALDALQDKAHSSTPKDLSFWYTSPGLLLDTLSKGEDDESCPWSETDVKRWASRAKTALIMLSWLNLYVTPV